MVIIGDRLTASDVSLIGCENRCDYGNDCVECIHIDKAIAKLNAYEDAEEQCIKECGCGLNMVIQKYKEFLEHMHELAEYWELEEQGLLLRLPIEIRGVDERIIKYALAKAMCLFEYGVDVDSKLEGAVETLYALHQAYMRGSQDAIDEMHKRNKEIRNKVIDEFAEKMSLEISESIIWDILADRRKNDKLSVTSEKIEDYVIETIMKIAEQMKREDSL